MTATAAALERVFGVTLDPTRASPNVQYLADVAQVRVLSHAYRAADAAAAVAVASTAHALRRGSSRSGAEAAVRKRCP